MFRVLKRSKKSDARLGVLKTPHGDLPTPCFLPDATRAVAKNLSTEDLVALKLDSLVVNTYHLFLQPGVEIIKKAGGVHRFMDWQGPILSDSGGYQVFSLIHKHKNMGKILPDRVVFKSPLDGQTHQLTPEKSIQIQFALGSDMIVALDDCPPNDYQDKLIKESVARTISWAARCRREYDRQIKKQKISAKKRPLLFAVIQGGMNQKLRQECARELLKFNFDGYSFGARPVDQEGNFLSDILGFTAKQIPEDKPRFALGIGLPEDIVRCVKLGWDIFDCVIPTREGRHGRLFLQKKITPTFFLPLTKGEIKRGSSEVSYRTININNAKFVKDFSPINPNSRITLLKNYTKAYLNHLFKIGDPLAGRLASLNNLEFYLKLITDIRQAITADKL